MLRYLAQILCLAAASLAAADPIPRCVDAPAKDFVDLGEPAKDATALRALQEAHPERMQKILPIVQALLEFPVTPSELREKYDAKDVCVERALPTMPVTNVLSFTVDEVRYRLRIQRRAPPLPR